MLYANWHSNLCAVNTRRPSENNTKTNIDRKTAWNGTLYFHSKMKASSWKVPFNAMPSICKVRAKSLCLRLSLSGCYGFWRCLWERGKFGMKKEVCWSLKGRPQLSALAFLNKVFSEASLSLSLSLSVSDLVWRLPECWCWQMWQLRGLIFGVGRKEECGAHSEYLLFLVCECIHALCLSNFCPPKFPSFFGWSCWFVAQLNKIAKQTDRWMKIISTRPCLRLHTNLGPGLHFGAWSLFWVSFLGAVLEPWILFLILGAPKGAQKWNPKQGPKYNPNQNQNAIQICAETQTRTCRDDLHSAVVYLGDLIQLCNKPTTSTKEGRETWAGKISQTESMNTLEVPDWSPEMSGFLVPKLDPVWMYPFVSTVQ